MKKSISEIIKSGEQGNYYMINPKFIKAGLSANAVIVLMHLIFMDEKSNGKEFSQRRYEISQATGLTKSQVRSSEDELKSSGLIEIERKGLPLKQHYKLIKNEILKVLKSKCEKSHQLVRKISLASAKNRTLSIDSIDSIDKTIDKETTDVVLAPKVLNKRIRVKNSDSENSDSTLNSTSKSNSDNPDFVTRPNSLKLKKIHRPNSVSIDNLLQLNPHKKSKAMPRRAYSLDALKTYKTLISIGATTHKKDTAAYYMTMDLLHDILSPAQINPYNGSSKIPKEYRSKIWKPEEVIDAFKYYISISDKPAYRTISTFIIASAFNGNGWSPLVHFHLSKIHNSFENLSERPKKLANEFNRLNIPNEFNVSSLNKLVSMLDQHTRGLKPARQMSHIYFNEVIYTFTEYVEEKLRNQSFKPAYMFGESFMKQYVDDCKRRGILVTN